MNKNLRRAVKALLVAAAVLCALKLGEGLLTLAILAIGLGAASLPTESASVGIIGGADGPTAIFLTSSPNEGLWLLLAALGLALAILALRRLSRNT